MPGVWKMKLKRRGAKKSRKGKKKARVEVEAEAMDVELWKEFPQELVEAVIARLPISTLIRFRLICRKWNSLPKSPHFQQLWSNFAPQKQPLFFAVARVGYGDDVKVGALCDPSTKEWHYTEKFPPSSYWGLHSAASAGGLLCYYDDNGASFRVGNCLTQTWKEFPWRCWTGPNPRAQEVIIGMVTLNQDYSQLSAGAGAYKIIWANSLGNYGVYDSMKDSTSPPISTGRIPANIELPRRGFDCRTVSIDTVVYFLTREPHGIISCDVVNGAWEQFLVPSPPGSCYSTIAECGGRLLLVAMVPDEEDAFFSVCVWELETAMLCWKEVDRMPSSWCSEFNSDRQPELNCLGNRRVLVMSLQTERRNWIVTYDVVNREWSKAPRFTVPRRHPRITNGAAFLPCLSASP